MQIYSAIMQFVELWEGIVFDISKRSTIGKGRDAGRSLTQEGHGSIQDHIGNQGDQQEGFVGIFHKWTFCKVANV